MPEHVHLLLETILRFQCMEPREAEREVELLACEPGGEETGEHLKDWPWSSWSSYEKSGEGLIGLDVAH